MFFEPKSLRISGLKVKCAFSRQKKRLETWKYLVASRLYGTVIAALATAEVSTTLRLALAGAPALG